MMSNDINLYDSVYDNFAARLLAEIRAEAFGQDIGQNSWLTVGEFREFFSWLELSPAMHVLDVCCGSGGPALFLASETGSRVTGIDASQSAIRAATIRAAAEPSARAAFFAADASRRLAFDDGFFDAIISIDAINHLDGRLDVFHEFHRVLKPGGRLLFTDPITVTGILSTEEIATRSQIGQMNFTPPGENQRLLEAAGFELRRVEDVTANTALTSGRRRDAREKYRSELIDIEGERVFSQMQRFLDVAHRLSSEHRLSRLAFLAVSPVVE